MASKNPQVSVVMSVYNGKRYLRDAVESILKQTFNDFEFIIIDDGSEDTTWDILTEFEKQNERIVLSKNSKNIGLTKSLNKGLRLARGKFIARQDADDISLPERLAAQVDYLESNRDVGLLGTGYYLIDEKGNRINAYEPPTSDVELRWRLLFRCVFCHTTVMFRRQLVEIHGLTYDEILKCAQDYDLWTKIMHFTGVANLATPLVELRQHEGQISVSLPHEQHITTKSVSAREINRLLPELKISDLTTHWYQQDITTAYPMLLKMLKAFGKKYKVEPKVSYSMRKHWTNRVLLRYPTTHFVRLLTLNNIKLMSYEDISFVMKHYIIRVWSHIVSKKANFG